MLLLTLTLALTGVATAAQAPDTGLYASVLKKYVREDGHVDYAGLRSHSAALDRFVAQIGEVSPDTDPALFPSKRHRLAYWINTYNALVLKAFSREYPKKRLRLATSIGKIDFFDRLTHRVGRRARTLTDIEERSIRTFGNPKIHFALVCASASCPRLARVPYLPENVDTMLEREARTYMSEERNFRLDERNKQVWLPMIFQWYEADFGGSTSAVMDFVVRYRTEEEKKLRSGKYRLRYLPYDWSPNDVR